MSELAHFKDGADQICPSCGATITFRTSNDGLSVEVLHPQPPCAGFRSFVKRLLALKAPN